MLASIFAFQNSTDLRRVQTPYSLFRDFGADKTYTTQWSGVNAAVDFKFESKFKAYFKPHASHLAITPEGHSRRQLKVLTAKSIAELLEHCLSAKSGTALAGWMGKHKHKVFPSQLQSLLAMTGSLEEKLSPLLQY